jgi:hypothetical protein
MVRGSGFEDLREQRHIDNYLITMPQRETFDEAGFIKKMAVGHLVLHLHLLTGGYETTIGEWPVLPDFLSSPTLPGRKGQVVRAQPKLQEESNEMEKSATTASADRDFGLVCLHDGSFECRRSIKPFSGRCGWRRDLNCSQGGQAGCILRADHPRRCQA